MSHKKEVFMENKSLKLKSFDICPAQLEAGCQILAAAIRRAKQDPKNRLSYEKYMNAERRTLK